MCTLGHEIPMALVGLAVHSCQVADIPESQISPLAGGLIADKVSRNTTEFRSPLSFLRAKEIWARQKAPSTAIQPVSRFRFPHKSG